VFSELRASICSFSIGELHAAARQVICPVQKVATSKNSALACFASAGLQAQPEMLAPQCLPEIKVAQPIQTFELAAVPVVARAFLIYDGMWTDEYNQPIGEKQANLAVLW
jgi:hypothetical protein